MKNRIGKIVLFALAVGLWTAGICHGQYAQNNKNHMSVRCEKGGVTGKTVDDYYEDVREQKAKEKGKNHTGEPDITLWSREKEETITNQVSEISTRVTVIRVSGNMEDVYPNILNKGVFPPKNDDLGCVVSRTAAWKLFQSGEVVGNTIRYGEKEYIIRGVVNMQEQMLLLQDEKAGLLPYVELSYPEGGQTAAQTKDFLGSYLNLQNYAVMVDGNFYAGVVRLFLFLPVWIILFFCVKRYIMLTKREKISWKKYTTAIVGGFVCLAVTGILVKHSIQFPVDFIPSRWSDFAFWTNKAKFLLEDWQALKGFTPLYLDVKLLQSIRYSVLCSLGSGICVAAFICSKSKLKILAK